MSHGLLEQIDGTPSMTKARNLYAKGIKQLRQSYNTCLWPRGHCAKKAVRAHSIQNSTMLDCLCRDGHVIMPRARIASLSEPPVIEFATIGRNQASTFTGLCAAHDAELFRPIETAPLDLGNSVHLFLLAYRAILKEAHASRKAAIDIQTSYLRGVKEGLYSSDGPSPAGMFAVDRMIAAYLVEPIRGAFNHAIQTGDMSGVEHQVVQLDTGPGIAVNSLFSADTYSTETDSLVMTALNIFPLDNRTVVVLSYLRRHASEVRAFHRWLAASGMHQMYELSKLVLGRCENFVIAPTLFESYSATQKEAMIAFFRQTILDSAQTEENPHWMLFNPV